MQPIKSFLRGIFASGFSIAIVLTAIVGVVVFAFGSPTTLKKTLANAGIYNKVTDVALSAVNEAAKQDKDKQPMQNGPGQTKEDEGFSIDLSDPEIKRIADNAFPPAYLQASTENLVDGMFRWLNGSVPQPDFSIDLTVPKNTLSQGLGDYVQKRVAALPVCTDGRTEFKDPFSDACVPTGTDVAKIKQNIVDMFNGVKKEGDSGEENTFLKNPIITAASLKQEGETQTPFDKLSVAPKAYQAAKWSPVAFGILALFSAAFLILLHDKKRRGLHNVAVSLVMVGTALVVFTFLINFLFNKANQTEGVRTLENQTRDLVLAGTKAVNQSVNKGFYIYGGLYILLGATTLLILHFTKPKEEKEAEAHHKHHDKSEPELDKSKEGESLEKTDKKEEPAKPEEKKPAAKAETKKSK